MRFLKVTVSQRFPVSDSLTFGCDKPHTRVVREFVFGPFGSCTPVEMGRHLRSMVSPPFELLLYSLSEEDLKGEAEIVSPGSIAGFLKEITAGVIK